MRVTVKGQVTIPQAIRERAGFLPGTEVEFVLAADGTVRVQRPAQPTRKADIQAVVARLQGAATEDFKLAAARLRARLDRGTDSVALVREGRDSRT